MTTEHNVKTLPIVTIVTDDTVFFGSDTGQSAAAPDPIQSTAIKDYVAAGMDPLFLTEGFSLSSNNTSLGSDPSYRRAAEILRTTDSSTSNTSFSNEQLLTIGLGGTHGQNTNGARMQAKKTFLPLSVHGTYQAAGQKFAARFETISYGMGDSAIWGASGCTFAGGPVNGDEGQGFGLHSVLSQYAQLVKDEVGSVTRSGIAAGITTTQTITGNKDSQTVTISSTTGIVVNDWLVIEQEMPRADPILEAVQVTAIGSGTITGKFLYNHPSGATVTAALVIDLAVGNGSIMGQDRLLVNLDGVSYSTGTAAKNTGAEIAGVGTSWATNMVGGDDVAGNRNIGAIAFDADDVTAQPFSTGTGRLRSWHQIGGVTNGTSLFVYSTSVAGDGSYKGKALTTGNYEILPSAKILRTSTSRLICETSSHTWTVGDQIECIICPYADVTGWQYAIAMHTPCGTPRQFMNVKNVGSQRFSSAYSASADGGMISVAPGVGGIDTVAFDFGFFSTHCDVGLRVVQSTTAGILLDNTTTCGINWGSGTTKSIIPTASGLKVSFGSSYLEGVPSTASVSGEIPRLLTDAYIQIGSRSIISPLVPVPSSTLNGTMMAVLNGKTASVGAEITTTGTGQPEGAHISMAWCDGTKWRVFAGDGSTQTPDQTVSSLPTAMTSRRGQRRHVTDSSVTTFGSTVAAGGSSVVPVFCNGTNWVVG